MVGIFFKFTTNLYLDGKVQEEEGETTHLLRNKFDCQRLGCKTWTTVDRGLSQLHKVLNGTGTEIQF